ncbi:MAG: nucleoside deaminase [Pseudopedobacter sp.]|nr:nucleoside deaminase [Deinococcales bacterium]
MEATRTQVQTEGKYIPGTPEGDRYFLECTLELCRISVAKGSSPVGCVIVNKDGKILAEGRNRVMEKWPAEPHEVADASFAHAEMVAFFRLGQIEDPENTTLYSSLEPCIMCGGAIGMVALGRAVWAADDPWGGSGRMIKWNEHPAYKATSVSQCSFPDLEAQAAAMFAPEAHKAYPDEGWKMWQERYPEACKPVLEGKND